MCLAYRQMRINRRISSGRRGGISFHNLQGKRGILYIGRGLGGIMAGYFNCWGPNLPKSEMLNDINSFHVSFAYPWYLISLWSGKTTEIQETNDGQTRHGNRVFLAVGTVPGKIDSRGSYSGNAVGVQLRLPPSRVRTWLPHQVRASWQAHNEKAEDMSSSAFLVMRFFYKKSGLKYFPYFFVISCPQHWRGTEHAPSPVPQLQVFSTLNSKPHNSQKNTSPCFISWQIAMIIPPFPIILSVYYKRLTQSCRINMPLS